MKQTTKPLNAGELAKIHLRNELKDIEDIATHEYRDYKWCWEELNRRLQ